MATMNVSLPDVMKDFVDVQVNERGFSSSSEYIRDLIRCDQVKQGEQRLATLMLESLESGPAVPVDETYWANKRAALKKRHSHQ
jgi:antitoxin ParD1/3/4